MSTLTDPDFSGRYLREVLRQRIYKRASGCNERWAEGSPQELMAFFGCFESPAERMPLLATR